MKENRQSATAVGVALARAIEHRRPAASRLLDDPFAAAFADGNRARAILDNGFVRAVFTRLLRLGVPGMIEFVSIRGRYSDDLVARSVAEGATQFVVLGAGFDTAALRLKSELAGADVFEIDHPATQAAKRSILDRIDPGNGARVRFVPVDFERDDMVERLTGAGFDPARRSVVTWMGVSYYLTAPAFEGTLDRLAGLLSPGSLLSFDYVPPAVIDRTWPHRAARVGTFRARLAGEPFLFGLEPDAVATLLARHGFDTVENVSAVDLLARYTRERRQVIDFAWLATARRTGRTSSEP